MPMRLDQLRNADLNLLVYFAVLVEEKSVTKAARRLRLTQSALSRVLRRVRELFDDDLLVRVNNSYQPTPRGQEIVDQLAVLLPQMDRLLSGGDFNPATDSAKFQITAADSLAHLYCPFFARRSETTPNLVVGFTPYSENRYRELEDGSRDLVLDADFKLLPASLHKEELFRDRTVCAVAKRSHFRESISLSEYIAAKHIAVNILEERQPTLDAALAKLNLARECTLSVPYFSVALRMVAGSDLIATLPQHMAESLVDRRTVRLVRSPREIECFRYVMVWHKRQHADPHNIWLRQTVREITSDLLASTATKARS